MEQKKQDSLLSKLNRIKIYEMGLPLYLVVFALVFAAMLLGWLPGVLGKIPFLQVGIPAVLSIYFDVFSSCMQAFIFAMLTMLYIGSAAKSE